MPAFTFITLSVPTHFLVPMLYGDLSALGAEDILSYEQMHREILFDIGHGKPVHIGKVKDQPYFTCWHDASDYGVLPCMCVDVDIVVQDEEV
jgi:hypothetical protein